MITVPLITRSRSFCLPVTARRSPDRSNLVSCPTTHTRQSPLRGLLLGPSDPALRSLISMPAGRVQRECSDLNTEMQASPLCGTGADVALTVCFVLPGLTCGPVLKGFLQRAATVTFVCQGEVCGGRGSSDVLRPEAERRETAREASDKGRRRRSPKKLDLQNEK